MTRAARHPYPRIAIRLLLVPAALLALGARVEPADPDPTKVGLALGGGGARGFAHIGVLRWLEEHRVPVHFIAGTSMGGLVGGATATGMTPKEIEKLITSVDWDVTFLGDTPYALKDFRRKEDGRQFQVALELGLKGGFNLPNSLDPGHQVGLLLSRLAYPCSTVARFDDLPAAIRFVAVDIENGDELVLDEGSLARSMRATMAVPGVFSPAEIRGRLLVDGGILNNVPADVVGEQAGVVIAVDVGAELVDRSKLTSALSQLLQSVDVMIADNSRQTLQAAQVIIRPELEGYTSGDWRKASEIIKRGYEAADRSSQDLSKYALGPSDWERYLESRASCTENLSHPTFIEVDGVEGKEKETVRARLRSHVNAQKPLDLAELERDLTALTGSGRYQSLSYEAMRRNGASGLRVRVAEKDYGPPFIRFSLDINNQAADVDFNFASRITAFDWGGDGAELRTDILIGTELGIGTELYRPIVGPLFVAPRAFARTGRERFYDEGVLTASFDSERYGAGMDLGLAMGSKSEFRAGYDIQRRDFERALGQSELEDDGGVESVARVRWLFDGQDRSIVPTRGLRTRLFSQWFFESPTSDEPFGKAELEASLFVPFREKNRLVFRGAFGSSFGVAGGSLPPFYRFTLGGPFRLGGFALDELRGDRFFFVSGGYLRSLGRLPDFVGQEIYVAGWVESGSAYLSGAAIDVRTSVTGGLLMETALGPFFLGASAADNGAYELHFALGRLVRLGR